ncbi:MAG: hypothetical protein NT094_00880 [Candidatus Staskawiczbacteria bacterium]|nr:hypothetical protein [Candidatus Staskawiczbacteria bacterium]
MERLNQGKQKLVNFIDDFIKSDFCQEQILKIRKKIGIPVNGFRMEPSERSKIIEKCLYYLPKKIKKGKTIKEINLSIKPILLKLPITSIQILCVLRLYLLYNEKAYEIITNELRGNLCEIDEIRESLLEYEFLGVPEKEVVDIIKKTYDKYPLVIKLHPDLSKRDLLAYVNEYWPIINYNLGKYKKSKIGKIRMRKRKERDNFIYKNKSMNREKLTAIVNQKFEGVIGYGELNKIISLETKRRREM